MDNLMAVYSQNDIERLIINDIKNNIPTVDESKISFKTEVLPLLNNWREGKAEITANITI